MKVLQIPEAPTIFIIVLFCLKTQEMRTRHLIDEEGDVCTGEKKELGYERNGKCNILINLISIVGRTVAHDSIHYAFIKEA